MGKKDWVRDLIDKAETEYQVAVFPKSINHAQGREPIKPDSINHLSRKVILIHSLDVKLTIERVIARLPKHRADMLRRWIIEGNRYIENHLYYRKRRILAQDRERLEQELKQC